MKLVIYTQYSENYGDEQYPRFKFKGGETLVVEDLTPAQVKRIESDGIPTLTSLIEYSNSASREYILDYKVVEDAASVGNPWDNIIKCVYAQGAWHASVNTHNDEYGYLRSDIGRRLEIWTMLPEGVRGDHTVEYYDRQGARMELERLTMV